MTQSLCYILVEIYLALQLAMYVTPWGKSTKTISGGGNTSKFMSRLHHLLLPHLQIRLERNPRLTVGLSSRDDKTKLFNEKTCSSPKSNKNKMVVLIIGNPLPLFPRNAGNSIDTTYFGNLRQQKTVWWPLT